MSVTTPTRFDSRELAKRIAAINGGEVKTVKVKMVGKEDVKRLIAKMELARNTPPSSKLRVR
ncbi:MAG: hypothetical protein K9M97_01950 [Akkermansiaceae bacterium]|nr:hypothetical protein [Akkermansiaceae bacterium]